MVWEIKFFCSVGVEYLRRVFLVWVRLYQRVGPGVWRIYNEIQVKLLRSDDT